MPLHDWSTSTGWEGVHLLWMSELQRHLKERLPEGYRSYLGAGPAVAIGAPPGRPDISVRSHRSADTGCEAIPANRAAGSTTARRAPDVEVEVAALEIGPALYVERDGLVVAAIELVSPRNKDRPSARAVYTSRYAGYLIAGVNLMLVDLHRRPLGSSFADGIAAELAIADQATLPPPMAVSYRVGEAGAIGGRLLAMWRDELSVGTSLPTLPLALTVDCQVDVDLEATYSRATADAYLT
jgi:hypothetical protein